MTRLLILLTVGSLCGACSAPQSPGRYTGPPLSPLYNVTPDMMRPDGAMLNGLMPENPNDQM